MASASSGIDCFYHFTPNGCLYGNLCQFSHSKISYRTLVETNTQLAKDLAFANMENRALKNTIIIANEIQKSDASVIIKMHAMERQLLKEIAKLKQRNRELEVAMAALQKAMKDALSKTENAATTPSAPAKTSS